ncbi:hypothetical protein EUTSA_v10005573mg [Eutrema salsugineum]|uniref:Mei2-like C-terminal RNA recognition motif domain-containing protein n=1 Tax=Eutrema salsugineum TaxID=72664 RepID=V4K6T7_EUTSA|nr:protein terminal ear1 homolog [Eutrema salsugineum]ESQ33305.1 hypothetical protein EUTSA_v10005573mg [Eutrema salsugineum]
MALDPNAPEFYPKYPAQEISKSKFLCPPSRPYHIYEPSKTFNAKPENFREPHRFWFCNRKCLPPRLLNLKPKIESPLGDRTSVMIRNIPNIFGRKDLLRILDNHCRKENKEVDEQQQTRSSYDFLYLPMDFVSYKNLGYAFVNFTSSVAAERFRTDFDNSSWINFGNRKICEITVAKYQGREEFSKHFKESKFPCHTDAYLPVILSPPSDGFICYGLTMLGRRVSRRGGGWR